MRKDVRIIVLCIACTFSIAGCTSQYGLGYALHMAGDNRSELESVLEHYHTIDNNPEKLAAARYLIEGLPAHYSYAGDSIYQYYN